MTAFFFFAFFTYCACFLSVSITLMIAMAPVQQKKKKKKIWLEIQTFCMQRKTWEKQPLDVSLSTPREWEIGKKTPPKNWASASERARLPGGGRKKASEELEINMRGWVISKRARLTRECPAKWSGRRPNKCTPPWLTEEMRSLPRVLVG